MQLILPRVHGLPATLEAPVEAVPPAHGAFSRSQQLGRLKEETWLPGRIS